MYTHAFVIKKEKSEDERGENEGRGNTLPPTASTPQIIAVTRTVPGGSQEPGSSSRPPV